MMQPILVGLAAGLAAALLFIAPMNGSMLALPLFILTGLPITIAALGWGLVAGLTATLAGVVVVGVVLPGLIPVTLLVALFAAPVGWLARLAGMSRPGDQSDPSGSVEWFPLGRLLLHATLAAAVGLVIAGLVIGYDPAAIAEEATRGLLEFMAAGDPAQPPPTADSIRPFVDLYVAILPFSLGMFMTAVVVFNLWLGAVTARASGRLARPPERLWTVSPPNEILIGFGVTLALAVVLPGAFGNIAAVFAGALGCALAMTGLAVLHAITVGMTGRAGVLFIAYALILISGLPLVLFAALGAAENFIHLRARRFGGVPPT